MANDNHPEEVNHLKRQGDAVLLESRLEQLEREQREAKERDETYKAAQVTLTGKMVRLTVYLVICTAVTGIISIWQAVIAGKSTDAALRSAEAAETSTHLALSTASVTQAAVLDCDPFLDWSSNTVSFDCENQGQAVANEMVANLAIDFVKLPEQQGIAEIVTRTITAAQIIRSGHGRGEVDLADLASRRSAVERGQQTVRVNATVSFDNGFGRRITEQQCRLFLGDSFVPCDQFARRYREMFRGRHPQ